MVQLIKKKEERKIIYINVKYTLHIQTDHARGIRVHHYIFRALIKQK